MGGHVELGDHRGCLGMIRTATAAQAARAIEQLQKREVRYSLRGREDGRMQLPCDGVSTLPCSPLIVVLLQGRRLC